MQFSSEKMNEYLEFRDIPMDRRGLRMDELMERSTQSTSALLDRVVDHLVAGSESLVEFVIDEARKHQPMSFSLFVVNPQVWQLMEKKSEHRDRMLPMCTIPWIHYSRASKTVSNPFGITRTKNTGLEFRFDPRSNLLYLKGEGGDFSGILEETVVEEMLSARNILVPKIKAGNTMVPVYSSKIIRVGIPLDKVKITKYPHPHKEFDYRYSESPKVFYSDGIEMSAIGENIRLKVSANREQRLRGAVFMLLGYRLPDDASDIKRIDYHVWLTALARLLTERQVI